jgi:hypothetical protein
MDSTPPKIFRSTHISLRIFRRCFPRPRSQATLPFTTILQCTPGPLQIFRRSLIAASMGVMTSFADTHRETQYRESWRADPPWPDMTTVEGLLARRSLVWRAEVCKPSLVTPRAGPDAATTSSSFSWPLAHLGDSLWYLRRL